MGWSRGQSLSRASGGGDRVMPPGSWRGKGACYPLSSYRSVPDCAPSSPPPESCDAARRPRVGFLVVGQARGFLDHGFFASFKRHVIDGFAAQPFVFLHLKLDSSANSSAQWGALASAVALLRPVSVLTSVERDDSGLVGSIALARWQRGDWNKTIRHPRCFWRDVSRPAPHERQGGGARCAMRRTLGAVPPHHAPARRCACVGRAPTAPHTLATRARAQHVHVHVHVSVWVAPTPFARARG